MSRVYFTDRDLGKQFPRLLADAGIAVERHADLFPPDGSDEQWLEYCGLNDRVAVTHNSRIRYVPNELAALVRFRVTLLVVVGKAPTSELALSFVQTLPRIEAVLQGNTPPVIVKVYRGAAADAGPARLTPGRAEVWYPKP